MCVLQDPHEDLPLPHCDRPAVTLRNKRLTAQPCGAGMALPLHLFALSLLQWGPFRTAVARSPLWGSPETTQVTQLLPPNPTAWAASVSLLPLDFCRCKKQTPVSVLYTPVLLGTHTCPVLL